MKALSIRQPWVWAITHAGKRVENRSWPCNYRGPVLLHASKWWSENQVIDALLHIKAMLPQSRWQQMQREITEGKLPLVSLAQMKATRGSLLARAEIVDCIAPGSRGAEGLVHGRVRPGARQG